MSEIVLIGDIALGGIISKEPGENGERYSRIIPLLQKKDTLVFANLEIPVGNDGIRNEYKKHIHYSLHGPTRDMLRLLNISCVSLANNHIYDCKMEGLKATVELLDDLSISHTGAGWKSEHVAPVIIEKNGLKVGFIAYVSRSTNPGTSQFPELLINYFEPVKVIDDIKSIRTRVDILICSIHWGIDYSYYPASEQLKTARELVDYGADIIMGHHSHTLQPFEKYKNGYIFYSLGSFTFGDYIREGKKELQSLFRKTKRSVIINYSFSGNNIKVVSTKELTGNYIIIDENRDYIKWSDRKWIHYKIKNSSAFFKTIYNFNEKVLYRIYEYFFGYYKNPIKRLIQVSNITKIKKLFQ